MKIGKLKIQGFRTVNRGFDCTIEDLSVFVGRNNAGKSCAVRALDLFFNQYDKPSEFKPHIRINPGSERKKRFSIIIGVWLSDLPPALAKKYSRYLNADDQLPVRLYYTPQDESIVFSCFKKGSFSTTKAKGDAQSNIITDINEHISVRIIPETRDLAREFQTELGHGFKALKEAVLLSADGKTSKEAKAYKAIVEGIINNQLVKRINKNLGDIIPEHGINIGNIENNVFSRIVLSALIDELPIFVQSSDSDEISIDQMGAGFQSAVLVALYRTVAQLEDKKLVLCVEEPEIHLDSHSQRYCYHHWQSQVEEDNDLNQVIITSHSAFLVDETSPHQLVLIRRDNEGCTTTSQLTEAFLNSIDIVKLTTKTLGLHNTDLFFSSFVILVEGEGDTVALRRYLELLLKHKNKTYNSLTLAGISIIDCGGKDGIRVLAQVIKHLSIPYVAIFDRDVIQEVDTKNPWKIGQQMVEKVFTKKISNNFKDQKDLFGSEAEFNRVKKKLESAFTSGKQQGFPRKLNEILREHHVLVMRTEHESDVVDNKNLKLVAKQFGYDLDPLEKQLVSEEAVICELKALNNKHLKKAFETAKLATSTTDWASVPSSYASVCKEIYRLMNEKVVRF